MPHMHIGSIPLDSSVQNVIREGSVVALIFFHDFSLHIFKDHLRAISVRRIQVELLCLGQVDLGSRVVVGMAVVDLAHHQIQWEVLQSLEAAHLCLGSPEEGIRILQVVLVLLLLPLALPIRSVVLSPRVC